MSTSRILGIDLGNSGAIAILTESGDLIECHDMPTLADDAKRRRSINAALVSDLIFQSHANRAYVEFVAARPTDSKVGAFSFGRARGLVEGILASANVPCSFITPPSWKRLIGIAPGKVGAKDAARSEAIRRWPGHASLFARKCDDGRAEAALIAAAGLMREKGGFHETAK